jgi:hypothetical protein
MLVIRGSFFSPEFSSRCSVNVSMYPLDRTHGYPSSNKTLQLCHLPNLER